MAISKYTGVQSFPLQLTAVSQLMERRVVTISSANVPAYATYGGIALGYITQRGDENDYMVTVMPFDFIDGTFFLDLAGTVATHSPLFATGVIGKVKTYTVIAGGALYTVKSRSLDLAAAPASGDTYIVPANSTQIATWNGHADITGAVYGDVVRWDGSNWFAADDGTTVATTAGNCTPVAGDVYYVADEGIFVIWSGTAWVEAPVLAYAGGAGVSGGYIACYRKTKATQVSVEQLDSGVRSAIKLVCLGQINIADNATSGAYHNDQILSTDSVFISKVTTTSGVSIPVSAVVTADTVTVTCTDPGADGVTVNILVVRAVS
jgi:hypothetical protein